MDINDRDILDILDAAEQAGHKDPIGLIARSDVLSGLTNESGNKTRFGITGVRASEVDRLEIGEASNVVDNITAAIKIDQDNYASYDNVGDMHVAFYGGGRAVKNRTERPKKFMRDLQKSKAKWKKRIQEIEKKKELPEGTLIDDTVQAPEIQQQQVSQTTSVPDISSTGDASKVNNIVRAKPKSNDAKKIPDKVITEDRQKLRSFIRQVLRDNG